ncbi:MAG: glmU, partial [Frankiales bacterium]|nr:glmU [Frankiales bacterium]
MSAVRQQPLTVIVLAAGAGTRMKSPSRPKVLHSFAGRSLLGHVLAATGELEPATTAVVVGHRGAEVAAHLAELAPATAPEHSLVAVEQSQQLGTGHAVRVALEHLHPSAADERGLVLVVPGDAPLLRGQTLAELVRAHVASGAAATMLTSHLPDPTGYGRVIRGADDAVVEVVEHKDASAAQREVTEVSALVYVFD